MVNHDGSVHTAKWIGATRDGLVLNQPFGSAIANGTLYVADRDGGTSDTDPSVSVLRMFDMTTGAPKGEIKAADSPGFNDIAVAADGTIYASQTNLGIQGAPPDPAAWKVFKVTPAGEVSVLIEDEPLSQPNGIELDGDGNIVVVNIGDDAVLTFSPEGELVGTEHAALAGNDGLVIMEDGTKYISSVRQGGVSRIRPGQAAELIATGIPMAASMCLATTSPGRLLPLGVPQVLIIGTWDEAWRIETTRSYAAAAAEAGDEVELLVLEGANHADVVDPHGAAPAMTARAVLSLVNPERRIQFSSGR